MLEALEPPALGLVALEVGRLKTVSIYLQVEMVLKLRPSAIREIEIVAEIRGHYWGAMYLVRVDLRGEKYKERDFGGPAWR